MAARVQNVHHMKGLTMLTPAIRQIIYTVAAIAAALIPVLVAFHVVEPNTGAALTNLVGILGAVGAGGAATAAAVLAKQRKAGTLDFTGTPAEQAVAAIQATVAQAGTATADIDKVRQAVADAIATIGNTSEVGAQIIRAAGAQISDTVEGLACGDSLR